MLDLSSLTKHCSYSAPFLYFLQVNIIPVIGKADAFTEDELKDFKQKVWPSHPYPTYLTWKDMVQCL